MSLAVHESGLRIIVASVLHLPIQADPKRIANTVGRYMEPIAQAFRSDLVSLLGWDPDVAGGVVTAVSAATSRADAEIILSDYLGGGSSEMSTMKAAIKRFLDAKFPRQAAVAAPSQGRRKEVAGGGDESAGVHRPSEEDIRQAFDMGVNVRTTVKRSAAKTQSSPPGLARKVVNCLKCGKVYDSRHPSADVMAFLGAKGTCTYCGHRVHLTFTDGSTNEDSESVDDQVRPKQEDRTRDDNAAASSQSQAQAQAQAEALRQRLVEYDRHSAKRTAVIDDQSDYFAIDSNAWLSDEERALLRRRHAEEEAAQEQRRKRLVVTVDLLGRRVLVERDERESEREDEEGGEQVDGGLIDRDGGAIAAAMAATAAERPQGGGTAAAVAALAPAARVTACPGVGETGRYVYVGGEKRGGLAGGKQSREQAEKFRKGGERVQHEDVFEVAAAELAALMGGVR